MSIISLDRRRAAAATYLFASLALAACGHDGAGPGAGGDGPDAAAPLVDGDPLSGLPTGAEQWSALCAQRYGDMISAKFCAGAAPPRLTSLADLEALLGLTVQPAPNNAVRITLNGESTGLGLRSVTPLTPRAFLMTPPLNGAPNPSYQILTFSRGEPLVELVANDPAARTLRFFLVRFQLPCEATGCTNADLQTSSIEAGWTGYSVYDDRALANTTLDCLSCHQAGGPSAKKILRMQELQNPWAHWFYPERPETLAIVDAFEAAHPGETYAGIPFANVRPSRPAGLQQLIQNNGFGVQPNAFDTNKINAELAAAGASATWAQLYAQATSGLEIPPSYFTNPYDPTKLQAMIAAYRQVATGALPRAQLPDVTDVFADAALAGMSIRPRAGLDGRGILVQMCQQCHNSRLDQALSRARFNVEQLAQLSREEKDVAIGRLRLPPADRRAMPPARFHELSAAERQLAIDELAK